MRSYSVATKVSFSSSSSSSEIFFSRSSCDTPTGETREPLQTTSFHAGWWKVLPPLLQQLTTQCFIPESLVTTLETLCWYQLPRQSGWWSFKFGRMFRGATQQTLVGTFAYYYLSTVSNQSAHPDLWPPSTRYFPPQNCRSLVLFCFWDHFL